MNTKKKTVLAAALVVAILALAGIGYAASAMSYKGETQSSTTTYDVDYVIVELDSDSYSPITSAKYITYDTVTTGVDTTTFKWKASTAVTQQVTVKVPVNSEGANNDPDTPITLTASYNDLATLTAKGYVLQYKIGAEGTWTNYESAVEITYTLNTAVAMSWRIVPNNTTTITADSSAEGIDVDAANFDKTYVPVISNVKYTATYTQA